MDIKYRESEWVYSVYEIRTNGRKVHGDCIKKKRFNTTNFSIPDITAFFSNGVSTHHSRTL